MSRARVPSPHREVGCGFQPLSFSSQLCGLGPRSKPPLQASVYFPRLAGVGNLEAQRPWSRTEFNSTGLGFPTCGKRCFSGWL